MSILINIAAFIFVLGTLVMFHELGHLLSAKRHGVFCHEFAIGMGPKLYSFRRKNDETLYSIRLLPIGGYVLMAGEEHEREEDEAVASDQLLSKKKPLQRLEIILAGVTVNFILAFCLFFGIAFFQGAPTDEAVFSQVAKTIPVTKEITLPSLAHEAGFHKGDRVVEVNGEKITSYDDFASALKEASHINIKLSKKGKIESIDKLKNPTKKEAATYINGLDKKVEMIVERDGKKIERKVNIYKLDVITQDLYRVGVGFGVEKHDVGLSFKYAKDEFGSVSTMIFRTFALLFGSNDEIGVRDLSGPVGIFTLTSQAASAGFSSLLYFTGLMSVNLGIFNLLPIPALDGGRALFIIYELITRRKVNEKIENRIITVSFLLLLAFVFYVTFFDLVRMFR